MKVLLIDVNCKNSSTGKIVYDIYSYLNQNDDEAVICYGRGKKMDEKGIFKFGLDWETYLHALLTRVTGFTGCYSFFSTRRLIGYIKKYKPDIVHIHELHAYFVNIKPLINFLKKNNIRTVHTLHCEFSYTGKCGYAEECEKWKTMCEKCSKVRYYPESLFFDWTKRMFIQKKKMFENFNDMLITTPSEWVTERAKNSFFGQHQIITVPNGIDADVFYPRETTQLRKKHGIDETKKVVISVAPDIMSERKGGKYVLELAKMRECKDIVFILIGVNDLLEDVPDNVITLPKITDQQILAQYYSLADVFLLCSKKETFSLTCAEALCCGVPIAGFRCGAPETVFRSPYAKFVEHGALDQLMKAVIEQMELTEKDVCQYGINNFSKEMMCKTYTMLYESIADKGCR